MVSVLSLGIPILVSAIFVFVASSILHMVLPFHRHDYQPVGKEDDVMEALRRFGIRPGDYLLPCPSSPAAMKDPKFIEKRAKGPIVVMTVMSSTSVSMGKSLAQWFAYAIVVSVFAAYVTGQALAPGADYLRVFQFAGTTAFLGYSLALMQHSIWYHRSWATTARSMIDGLIYGLLTAGAFGWLWPD
jgi:hypothetical protein